MYTGFINPGGCIRPWMSEYYAPLMNALNFCPARSRTGRRSVGRHLGRTAGAQRALRSVTSANAARTAGAIESAPGYDRVQCAVLLIEGWADWYATEEPGVPAPEAPKKG
jgi:hypothetical protein